MPEFNPVFKLDDIDGQNGVQFLGAAASDDFARASAGAGDVNGDGIADLIFGAREANLEGNDRGAAYVVFGTTNGFATLDAANGLSDGIINISDLNGTTGFALTGSVDFQRVGIAVNAAGDVNNDGFDDVIIGADGSGGNRAFLIFGQDSGFAATQAVQPGSAADGYTFLGVGTNSNEQTGYSVSGGADVNGDGFDDVLIGAIRADPISGATNTSEGAVYLIYGGDTNLNDLDAEDGSTGGTIQLSNLDEISEGGVFAGETTNSSALAGYSVSDAGDVNGDGFDDFIIGSRNADPTSGSGNGSEGAAYIVFGRPDSVGWNFPEQVAFGNGVTATEIRGVDGGDTLGAWVAGGGDINGDGFDDVVVAAPRADSLGANSSGSAYIIFGKSAFGPAVDPAALDGTNGFRIDGLRGSDYGGISVAIAGDINGDGFDDIAFGAHFFDQAGASNTGAVFIVFGKADGFDAVIDLGSLDGDNGFRIDGPSQSSAILGRGMSGPAGDVNGDGFDDIVLGAYRYDDPAGGFNHGAGYVVYGHMAQGSVTRVGTHLSQTQHGGHGDDFIYGNDGNDTLFGHDGDDYIEGGADNDTIDGGSGFDIIKGGSGNDIINAGVGDDEVDAGSGNDTVIGGAGSDKFLLREGDDVAQGNFGNDELDGGLGDDLLIGGTGDDILIGGGGNDTMIGGTGNDVMTGGLGDDIYFFEQLGDTMIENAGEGIDEVRSVFNTGLADNFENLLLRGQAVIGTGNNLDNVITAGIGPRYIVRFGRR